MVVAMRTAAAFSRFMGTAKIPMSSELRQCMTGYEDPGPREDTLLDSFFDGELSTATVTDASEASMQHLSRCVRLSKQVDVVWISKCL
jgi:hypothetical protein